MNDTRSDSELLLAARRDPEAFDAFYDRHERWVYCWFRHEVGDPDLAQDLTAETFARALVAVHRFRGVRAESGRAWLNTIAHRLLSRFRQRGRLEQTAADRLGVTRVVSDVAIDDCDDRLSKRVDSIGTILNEIPTDQAAAVKLRVVEELEYDEIATRLDCTPVAARLRVSRGLRTARARLNGGSAEH